jgi:GntR family transcriptional regulator
MIPFPEPELVLTGGAPIHRQIREQIRTCIVLGLLRPGEQLPTVRNVAVELGVNPNAVSRAYAELERDGLVSTEDGSGTFVAPVPAGRAAPGATAPLERLCADFVGHATALGFAGDDVLYTIQALVQRRSVS